MGTVNKSISVLTADGLPGLTVTNQLESEVQKRFILLLEHVEAKDAVEMERLQSEIANGKAANYSADERVRENDHATQRA